MRGDSSTMRVLRPKTAPEALRLYGRVPHALPIAGATDFMVSWNAGALNGRTVLDLWGIREWRGIQVLKDRLRIGALATHARIQEHPAILERFPLLAQACSVVGAAQIQNRGTLGGNIANASPAGDTLPVLSVYDAKVCVACASGRRLVALSQMFAGVKKTTLRPGELIEAVELPFLSREPSRAMFRKVGQRAAQTISKVVAAGLLFLKKDGAVDELRFSLGSVAPTVRRLKSAESAVQGRAITPEAVDEACSLIGQNISPIDDIRSIREYRLHVTEKFLRSFLLGKPVY